MYTCNHTFHRISWPWPQTLQCLIHTCDTILSSYSWDLKQNTWTMSTLLCHRDSRVMFQYTCSSPEKIKIVGRHYPPATLKKWQTNKQTNQPLELLVKHSGLSAIAGGQDNKETPVALLPRSPTIALLCHRMSFNCQCSWRKASREASVAYCEKNVNNNRHNGHHKEQ